VALGLFFPHPLNKLLKKKKRKKNPIEPVWLELKHILQHRRHTPTTIDDLKEAVWAAWEEIPIDTINRHINRMPARASAVFTAKGGHTRF
jgi:hypothetical protein